MLYPEQNLQIKIEWFEVWYDEGLTTPYFLLLAKLKNIEEYMIYDISKSYKVDKIFKNYNDALLFLTEDEYSCVRGRESIV